MSEISAFPASHGIALRLAEQDSNEHTQVSDGTDLSVAGLGGVYPLGVSAQDPGLNADAIEHAFFDALCVERGGG